MGHGSSQVPMSTLDGPGESQGPSLLFPQVSVYLRVRPTRNRLRWCFVPTPPPPRHVPHVNNPPSEAFPLTPSSHRSCDVWVSPRPQVSTVKEGVARKDRSFESRFLSRYEGPLDLLWCVSGATDGRADVLLLALEPGGQQGSGEGMSVRS